MLLASAVGSAGFVWLVVAGIAAVFPERRMAAWRVVMAIAVTSIAVDLVIKPLVHRPRPPDVLTDVRVIDQRPITSSFPSGHTARAFAGALAVSRLLPSMRVAWWALAMAIGISRIYVGVHWPSDVIAGALVGLALAWFALGGRSIRAPERRVVYS